MRKRKLLIIMLMLSVLLSSVISFASGKELFSYEAFLEKVREEHNIDVKTPTSMFDATLADGTIIQARATDPIEYDMLEGFKVPDIPYSGTVNIGDKIKLTDMSIPGSGSKISSWDWQVYHMDREGGVIGNHVKSEFKNQKEFTVTAEHKGEIHIYLNAADNFSKIRRFTNHSEYGNLRANEIRNLAENPDIQINGWPFTMIKLKVEEKPGDSNMIMRELELVDPETGEVIESFKRKIDNVDPFNIGKQKLIRTSINPTNASVVKRGKKYTLRAKYQYVSFEEGKFDISKPSAMKPEQKILSTSIVPNDLDVKYSYDEKWNQSGVFDEEKIEISKDKGGIKLKNLETASFEWTYTIPARDIAKQYIKFSGIVTNRFKEVNTLEQDDWAVVFAKIEGNDLGMHKNVRLFNKNNETVTSYRKDEPFRVIFPVEHVEGKDIVGKDTRDNPKVIIKITVTDENNKIIHEEKKVQTQKELNPKEIIDMPISRPFVPKGDKIKICAEIDPIHKEKGYNDKLANDKICVTYKAGGVDIGIKPPIRVFQGGKEVQFIEPNKSYTMDVDVSHIAGEEAVGLDASRNPKVRVRYTVTDARKRVLLDKEAAQTNQVLNPKGTVKMPRSSAFSTETGMVRVCAEIDPIHKEKGYNFDPSNDGPICRDLFMVKNYAVRELKVFPGSINFGKDETVLEDTPVTLTFTVSNESNPAADKALPSSPIVKVVNNGETIWEQTVLVPPGGTSSRTITIPRDIRVGDNVFTVEINPYRTEIEFKPGMSNPYIDNRKSSSIVGVKYAKCQECMTGAINKRNEWTERWEWTETLGTVKNSTYRTCVSWRTKRRKNGESYEVCSKRETVPYQYCKTYSYREWHEDKDYYETFEIEKIEFGSKMNSDKGSKYVDIKRPERKREGKIKAGYGFELKVTTRYKTNRNIMPKPDPREWNKTSTDKYGRYLSTACNIITRTPGVTPIDSPNKLYMEMPYMDKSGERVCYILEPTSSSYWADNRTVFELPARSSLGGDMERKIYINENAAPNDKSGRQRYRVDLVTPRPDKPDRFYGYFPENQIGNGKKPTGVIPGSYLHDCDHFFVVIYPQDDMKTHISQ